MEIMSSPLPTLPVDVGDASMQRDLALKLAAMTLASQAARSQVTPPPTTDTVARTLLSTLTALATGQDSLGQLLADIARPEAQARLPAEIRAEIARVLVLARPVVQASQPAPASTIVPMTTAPPLSPDAQPGALASLANALERLQAGLKAWLPVATQGQGISVPPSSQPSTPVPTQQPPAAATLPLPAQATATATAQPGLASQPTTLSGAPAAQAALQSAPRAPQAATATDPLQSAAANILAATLAPPSAPGIAPTMPRPGGIADALASLLLAQQSGATPEESVQRLRAQRQSLPAGAEPEPQSTLASSALSAYRKAMPAAPVPSATQWPADPSAALVAKTLLQRTEAALSQTRLLDVATQLQRAEQAPTHASNTTPGHWTFDLPLATAHGQAMVHFELDRQARKSGTGRPEAVWRARLSLDLEPLGPIHAQIAVLGTSKTWVSLWAERPETAHLLAEGQSLLRQSMGAEDLEAEIVFHGGPPPATQDGNGNMWDASV